MTHSKKKTTAYKPMESLGNVLTKSLLKRGLSSPVKQHDVREVWESAVGKDIARNAKPAMLKKGMLYVHVKNSTWMQELSLLKENLIEAINSKLGREDVVEMRFKITEFSELKPETEKKRSAKEKLDLPSKVEQEIEDRVKHIEDPEIKRAMKNLMARGFLVDKEKD